LIEQKEFQANNDNDAKTNKRRKLKDAVSTYVLCSGAVCSRTAISSNRDNLIIIQTSNICSNPSSSSHGIIADPFVIFLLHPVY
jgi:hypothetical protein